MRFVEPVRAGLGLNPLTVEEAHALRPGRSVAEFGPTASKTQTIRAGRERHAVPGEELQLYCGMRTAGCFLIGRARCTEVAPIKIDLVRQRVEIVLGTGRLQYDKGSLDPFARKDGFADWSDMLAFWREEHDVKKFAGVVIQWRPL